MEDFVNALVLPSFSLIVLVVCCVLTRGKWRWALCSVLYLYGYSLVLTYAPQTPTFLHLHYNWLGKAFAVLYSFGAALTMRLKAIALGLRLPRTWRSTALGIAAAFLFASVVGYYFRRGRYPGGETLLYQAILPGLDEELAFRGVLFTCLLKCFGKKSNALTVGLTSLIFGFGHGVTYSAGHLHLEAFAFTYTAALGLLFAAMRSASGSLLGPLLAHNLANETTALASWLSHAQFHERLAIRSSARW